MTQAQPYALVNLALLDVDAGEIREPATILVDGAKIAAVEPGGIANDRLPEQRFDCRGFFAMPGLIDMHVHVHHSAEHGPALSEEYWNSPVAMTLNAVRNLHTALQAGITSVRDLGTELDFVLQLKREQERGRVLGARLFAAGHMITSTGGHGVEYGQNMGLEVCGVEEVRRAVRMHIARGMDVIKLVTSSATTHTELTLDELKAGVEEAHWQGVKVACHATFRRRSVLNTVISGCDTLEHGCVIDEEIADLMVEHRTTYCPTLKIVGGRIANPDNLDVNSPEYLQAVRTVEAHQRSFRLVHERGLNIIAGTDAGWRGMPFDALHEELRMMCDLGLTTREAIQAVTSKAADALGMPEKVGRLQPGAFADILLTGQNPLATLDALRDPDVIIAGGAVVKGTLKQAEPVMT